MNSQIRKQRDAILSIVDEVGERLSSITYAAEHLSSDDPSTDEMVEFVTACVSGDLWLAENLAPRLFQGDMLAAVELVIARQTRRAA